MSKNSSKTPLKTSDLGTQADILKKSKLKDYLHQLEALNRICQSEDYRLHLKPILEAQFHNKWLAPEQFPSLKEFHKAYVEVQKRAEAYKEVRDLIETAEVNIINVTKQMNSPEK